MNEREQLLKINTALLSLADDLRNIEWSEQCLRSNIIGVHFIRLQTHLDNAQGRCSTLADTVLKVEREAAWKAQHLND